MKTDYIIVEGPTRFVDETQKRVEGYVEEENEPYLGSIIDVDGSAFGVLIGDNERATGFDLVSEGVELEDLKRVMAKLFEEAEEKCGVSKDLARVFYRK
ncbi:hypothetical protein [Salinibacter ruber]|nr:hypothetical protein [Salinibacter ruber]MCS3673248.1 hypothetical protein [Salinibacter ruber]